jgi:hypothetical protein
VNPEYHESIYASYKDIFTALWQTFMGGFQKVVHPITLAPKYFGQAILERCLDAEEEFFQNPGNYRNRILRGIESFYKENRNFNVAGRSIKSWIEIASEATELSVALTPEQLNIFDQNVECSLHGRKVMTSRKGYIGLGPGETRVGDMLCVLLGGKLPVVLRPVQDG